MLELLWLLFLNKEHTNLPQEKEAFHLNSSILKIMTSTLNTLKSNSGSRKKKLRKGRGIAAGQGASCGFGMRGQKSRSGRPTRPGFEGGQMPLYRRVPKLKHFEIINQKNFSIINLDKLNNFKDNDTVNLDSLVKKGLIFKPKFPLKILGNG